MKSSTLLGSLRIRRIHRILAPIMLLPLILTALTGATFQMFDLSHNERKVRWLLALHTGHFGSVNLSVIYPFLNALGLLILAVTGISMWWQQRQRRQSATSGDSTR